MIGVVVVEDHALVRAGLEQLLGGTGDLALLGSVAAGEDAAALVLRTRPDVVLMDISLPGIDGIAATRTVLEVAPAVAVVMLTSFEDAPRVRAAVSAGATGYVLKDGEPAELVKAIRAAARGEAPLAAKVARDLLRPAPPPVAELSPREREVLALVGEGLANKVIALRLGISEKTVKAHLTRIFQQLGVSDRTGAAVWAARHGA